MGDIVKLLWARRGDDPVLASFFFGRSSLESLRDPHFDSDMLLDIPEAPISPRVLTRTIPVEVGLHRSDFVHEFTEFTGTGRVRTACGRRYLRVSDGTVVDRLDDARFRDRRTGEILTVR